MNDMTSASRAQVAAAYRRLAEQAQRAADTYADRHGGHLPDVADPVLGAVEGVKNARALYAAHRHATRREASA